jgi:hypothetical protein
MAKLFGERQLDAIVRQMLNTETGVHDAYVQLWRLIHGGCFGDPDRALDTLDHKVLGRSSLTQSDLARLRARAESAARQQEPIFPPTLKLVRPFDREPQPIEWLFDGLIPKGSNTLVHADPKIGKSWLCFYLAICLANKRRTLEAFTPNERGKTLILSPEGGLGAVDRRLWGLAEGLGVSVDDIREHVIVVDMPGFRLDQEEPYERLLNTVHAAQPTMVVIDPIIEFHDADENAARDVSRLLGQVSRLREVKPDLCCVITHHNARGSRHARGSTAFEGWYDVRISLTKDTRQTEWNDPITASFSCRDGQPPKTMRYRLSKPPQNTWASHCYEPVYLEVVAASESREMEIERQIREVLEGAGRYTLTKTQLRNSLAIGGNDARSAIIDRLIRGGTIDRQGTKLALVSSDSGGSNDSDDPECCNDRGADTESDGDDDWRIAS